MRRIELLAVQLDEAKRLISLDSVPHMRLAFILLDNAVELIMYRMINRALELSDLHRQTLDMYQRLPSDNPEVIRHREDLRAKIIPSKLRRSLERYFDAKVEFLMSAGRFEATIGAVAKKLHKYRNEVYHRDHLRFDTIRPATLVYFAITCRLFAIYRPSSLSYSSNDTEFPALARFLNDREGLADFELPARIGGQLLDEIGLDSESIRRALIEHLLSRLDDIQSSIEFIKGSAPGDLHDELTDEDVIRIVQLPHVDPFLALEALRRMEVPYTVRMLQGWREEVEALSDAANELEVFAQFAKIEDEFEPLENLVVTFAAHVDQAIQTELDIRRGK